MLGESEWRHFLDGIWVRKIPAFVIVVGATVLLMTDKAQRFPFWMAMRRIYQYEVTGNEGCVAETH